MAKAAWDEIGDRIDSGVVVTKYDHSKGPIGKLEIFEAGHPVSDANSYAATERALECVSDRCVRQSSEKSRTDNPVCILA